MNFYRYTFVSECPANGESIIYSLEIRSAERIMVEHIKTACALHRRAYHEDIAADLRQRFGADLTLTANHHGVTIETSEARASLAAPSEPAQPITKEEVQELLRDSAATVGDYWQRVADRFNARTILAAAQKQPQDHSAAIRNEAVCGSQGAAGVQESEALERQRRLVATLPQTQEQVARLTPCAALTGKGAERVKCGHCGQMVTPGGECTYGVRETAANMIERLRSEGCTPDQIAAELADAGLDSEADAAGLSLGVQESDK